MRVYIRTLLQIHMYMHASKQNKLSITDRSNHAEDAAKNEDQDAATRTKSRRGAAVCERCATERAAVRRPKDGARVCRTCFYALFEDEIHRCVREKDIMYVLTSCA